MITEIVPGTHRYRFKVNGTWTCEILKIKPKKMEAFRIFSRNTVVIKMKSPILNGSKNKHL